MDLNPSVTGWPSAKVLILEDGVFADRVISRPPGSPSATFARAAATSSQASTHDELDTTQATMPGRKQQRAETRRMAESGETGGWAVGDLRPQLGQSTVDWLPRLRRDFGHRLVNTSEAQLMNRSHVTAT
ncbi:MAG TPA: hypothetical protein DCE47_18230 [Planctomycetaceae bacterium]|nr:hypothetical protein [Planctomycetaceae bacterium]